MKRMRLLVSLFVFVVSAFTGLNSFAASENDAMDTSKGDFKWFQFNIMHSIDNKIPFRNQQDTYLEMEFGGRSGAFDIYGYLDVFDIFDSSNSDRHGKDNFFFKFAPRASLNVMSGKDLSLGAMKEFYISGLMNVGDQALFEQYIGLGTDVDVPWLGKMGANLMARYVRENFGAANERRWDGYILSTNWFKPVITMGASFISYQGYLDYKFLATQISDANNRSEDSLEWFNGVYYHTPRYAVGYGLKYYKDMALFKDGGIAGETTGFGHYLAVTYKY